MLLRTIPLMSGTRKKCVSIVKEKGATQPTIIRSCEDGNYEIVSGHRRQKASELDRYAPYRPRPDKRKRPETILFQVFLVEISGIEPLTS